MAKKKAPEKPKSRSGTTLTDDERSKLGWAPRLELRMRSEEADIVERRALDGESKGVTIRRIIREFDEIAPRRK